MRYGVAVIFLERSQKPVEFGLFGISPIYIYILKPDKQGFSVQQALIYY